jgi:excisionase family DNA binding protein
MAKAKRKHVLKHSMSDELPAGMPCLLNVQQACMALAIKPTKLYGLIADKQLRGRKLGDRLVIHTDDITKYVATLPDAVISPVRRRRRT